MELRKICQRARKTLQLILVQIKPEQNWSAGYEKKKRKKIIFCSPLKLFQLSDEVRNIRQLIVDQIKTEQIKNTDESKNKRKENINTHLNVLESQNVMWNKRQVVVAQIETA